MMRHLRFHLIGFISLLAFLATAIVGSISWTGLAQAAVVFEGSSSGYNDDLPTDGSAGALTLTRPAVAKPGMVMIASIAARPHDMVWTAPAGWTQLSITAEQPDGGSSTAPGGMTMKTFYKVVGVSEPNSYTWTFANTYNDGGSAVGGMLVYSGIDTSSSPLDGTPTSRLNNSSTTQRTTAITTTVPNAEVVAMISYLSAGTFSYSGTLCGTVERLDVRAPNYNDAIGTTLQMGNFTQATPGTTCAPQSTANGNADTGLGHLLALKPSDKDLVLALSRSGPLTPGGAASYSMTITNAGTQVEPGPLTIISTLPTGLSYVSASGTGWSCSAAGSTVTCQKTGSLAVGAAATTLVLNVNVASGTSGEKTFTATASGTGGDGNTVNNTATDTYVIPTTAYAEYRMDETSWGTILDSSGNGRNASTVGSGATATPSMPVPPGAAITGTPGTCGAGKLPNTTGANGVSTPVDVNSLGNAGTIAFWYASSEGWRTNNRILFDASNEFGNGGQDKHFYLIKDSNGRLVFALEDNADTDSTAQSPSYNFAANSWHHIAVTWDLPNDRLYIYLDGDTAPVATSTTNVNGTLGDMATLYLGAQRNSSISGTVGGYTNNTLNGYIDEVRLYGSALSAAEIADIADRTHSCGGVSIATPGAISEGNSGTSTLNFTVSLDAVKGSNVTVNYATSNGTATGGGSCTAGIDYVTTSGTLTIPAGSLTGTVPVTICGDTMYETNETFTVTLSSPVGVLLGVPSSASGTINNDDNQPSLSLADTSAAEGNSGTSPMTFTVSLSNTSYQAITVNYSTADGSATGASSCSGSADYQSVTSGTATIAAGAASGTFSINICGDATNEPDETFNVTLSSPTNATLGTSTASGTITNDDLYCYIDKFTGANNSAPSSDWRTTSSSGTFGQPKIYNDRLRLTDASTNVSTAAHLQKAFPGAGNKIIVDFDYYAYNGSGADGIALTFSDASVSPYAGAYGGSLGYAQKTGINGFAGGWLGIGIDEYGNFRNDEEGRGNGGSPTGLVPDSVSVRGSGSGTSGYLIHVESGGLSPGVDQPGTTAGPNHKYRITIDHMDGTHAYVKVERNTGSGYTTIIPQYDAKAQSGQAAVPTNWLLSFTGSTGSSTNIHEIDNLQVCAYQPILPLGPDHYVISHSGTGLTCEAEPVTITAHDAGHTRKDANGYTISLTTSTGKGNWSASADGCTQTCYNAVGGAQACAGIFTATPAGSNTGIASYKFASGESGVRLCLRHNDLGNVNVNVTDGVATESSGTASAEASPGADPNIVYSNTGFRFYADGNVDTLGSLIAGLRSDTVEATLQPVPQNLTIRALKSTETTPARCVSLLGAGTQTVKFAYQCVDPAACHASSAGLEVNGTAVAGSMAVPTPATDVSVAFNGSGAGTINLKYWDVGQIKLYAQARIADALTGGTAAATGPLIATGASNTFLVKPYGFDVKACTTAAPCSVANTSDIDGTGSVFAKAGDSFNVTVKAVAYGGTVTTPSFGLGTGNTTEYVQLSSTVVAPSGGSNGTLGGTAAIIRNNFNDGVASITDLSWSEVGVMTLGATNALFQNVTSTANGASGEIGRFYPHHFQVSDATITNACTNGPVPFTYFGEDGFTAVFTLTAQNASGGTTTNYAGDGVVNTSWAKLPLATWGAAPASAASPGFGFAVGTWTPSQPGGSTLAASGTEPSATSPSCPSSTNAWCGGTAIVTAKHKIIRPTASAEPTTVTLTTLPVDRDGVTLSSAASLGSVLHRYGRLRIANAFGSEHLALPMSALMEYYNGGRWVTNADDSCTKLSVLGGPSAAVSLAPDGSTTPRCNVSGNTCEAASGVACNASNAITNGNIGLCLTKPGKAGQADISFAPPAYLQINGVTNPKGRAGFGIYNQTGNSQRIIHRQELR